MPGLPEAALQNMLAQAGAAELDRIPPIDVRILRVPADQQGRILEALRRHPNIAFAESEEIVEPDYTPDDPYYGKQWHLPKIGGPSAWDATTGRADIIIAILDTGVDPTHPDLSGLLVPGWNFYDNNSDTRDVYGHGTTVAGSAAAMGNNGVGVASVSWQCRIMPIRISSTTGGATLSAMASGVTFAADHGARVANISYNAAGRSSTVQAAARYMQERGGVVTVSSGNDGVYIDSPDNEYVLVVGATGSSDSVTSFSNSGPHVDLTAPGSSIYSTANGGGYRSASGTSFSAPITAGVAAMVMSVNPNLTGRQVQDILKQTAVDLGPAGYDTSYGHGRVDVHAAVLAAASAVAADGTPPAVQITSPGDNAVLQGTVTVSVSSSDNVGVAEVEVYVGGDYAGSSTSANTSFSWDTRTQADGPTTLTAVAFDAAGNQATSSVDVTVDNVAELADVTPPKVSIIAPSNGTTVTRSVKVTTAQQDDTGIVKLELRLDGRLLASAVTSASSYTFNWNTAKLARGLHSLQALAMDAAGNLGASALVEVRK